jgi:DNA-binding NarL/FixJ family response regulator
MQTTRRCPADTGFKSTIRGKKLTAKELEIGYFLCLGLTNRQIAEKMSVREATIKYHLTHIYKKLDVLNRTQAVVSLIEF